VRAAAAALGGLWLAATAALWTPASAGVTDAATSASDARTWLARLQSAARTRNYEGTLVFAAGEVVSSSRVAHYCVDSQTFERIEALDGREHRVYRHNDLVHSVWPRDRVVAIEQRDVVTTNPLLADIEPRVAEYYELRTLGVDRVAGREAHVLLLKARDALRFSQRVWADAATGLMLRTDVLGPQGSVLESSAFSQVAIDVRPHREAITVPMRKLDGYRQVRYVPVPVRLEDEGLVLARVPAGFRLVGSVRRPIDPLAGADGADPPRAVQAVYSDGLVRVSIFIEPLQPGRQRQPLATQLGATHTLMKPLAERWWITLMGDVPAETLKAFLSGLERRQ
jgi:sigma-E factor negative regulatory protein RseB